MKPIRSSVADVPFKPLQRPAYRPRPPIRPASNMLVDPDTQDYQDHRMTGKVRQAAGAGSAREKGRHARDLSKDAAIEAGAPKAKAKRLRHLTAIWTEKAKAEAVRFLAAPMHKLAVPDTDRLYLARQNLA
ncbi:hypothetical protein NKJ70_19830 [Mesorhizobium sp. M0092]|uniref:hypothetical protein n=2 Tax=unclassified Mesorhizobium TaxID=325217 RepID=UPI003334B5A4